MRLRKARISPIAAVILLGAFLAVVAVAVGLGGDRLNAIQALSGQAMAQGSSGQVLAQDSSGHALAQDSPGQALAQDSSGEALAQDSSDQVLTQGSSGQALADASSGQIQTQASSGQAQASSSQTQTLPQAQASSGQVQAQASSGQVQAQPQAGASSVQPQTQAQAGASSAQPQPQSQPQPEIEPPRGFTKVAENGYLALCVNEETTEIAVIDKQYGQVWFSNPVNRATNEKIARGAAKNRLSSQLTIVYYTPTQARKELDSYNDSVLYGQFEIRPLENGVRIDYIIGKQWDETSFLPVLVSAERLQQIVDSIERDRDKKLFYDNYLPLSLEPVGPDYERVEISEVDSRSFLGDYALRSPGESLTTAKERELFAAFVDTIVKNRSDVERRSLLQASHVSKLLESMKQGVVMMLNPKASRWDIEDMTALIKETGYTPFDVQDDHIANDLDPPKPKVEVFAISIEYRLDGRDLVVTVPLDEIQYPADVLDASGNHVSYPLHSVSLLDYFSAADQSEEGYIFVPDGSGALIYLNNGKLYAESYRRPVYGPDYATQRSWDAPTSEQIRLPVFGIRRGDTSLVGIIEDGVANTRIKADIAGRTNSYNTVCPEIIVMPEGRISLPSEHWNTRSAFQARKSTGKVSVRYGLLYGDSADYVGMAAYYRDFLMSRCGLERVATQGDIPFFVELIGGVSIETPVLGAPIRRTVPLTTFSECQSIIGGLLDAGVANIRLRYSGWLEGGLDSTFPYKAEMDRALGSREELRRLQQYLAEQGVNLFPDVSLLNSGMDDFNRQRDASRFLDRQVARVFREEIAEYDYQRGGKDFRYVVSPGRLEELVDRFLDGYVDYGFEGMSLRYMGTQVNSDFNVKAVVDRGQAEKIIRNQLQKFRQTGQELMVSGGNALALPYARNVVEVPTTSSRYFILDETVPFYQIAVHGLIDYAGEPINTSVDPGEAFLRAAETGSSLYYRWVYRDPSILKDTEFSYLMSVYYRDFESSAVALYGKLNSVLGDVQGQLIVDHERLAAGVYKTTYENGRAVIVNYNYDAVTVEGIEVGARDFVAVAGGERDK